jgi:DNA-binding CsgD family transcriptional regulator
VGRRTTGLSKRAEIKVRCQCSMQAYNQAIALKTEAHINIFGPLKLQNELVCEFLERSTGLKCAYGDDPIPTISDIKTKKNSLILWDCIDTDPANLWASLDVRVISQSLFAIFNFSRDLVIYRQAISLGVRGIFFVNENPEVFTKGVLAILNGELWFSRDILAKCLLETGNSTKLLKDSKPRISSREREILVKIASGSANSKIAKELCISPHTVKTHLYNIYKKIDAPNRLQAALWAIKNL